jgi:cell division protein FtsL
MFKYVILFVAFALAGCAAWFSVSGIAQLFVGATIAAGVMAASLEAAKIVAVSFLYRYWSDMSRTFRTYMWIGTVVLMLITSVGIYGYLTAAYAQAATGIRNRESHITLYQSQTKSIDQNIERLTVRSDQLIQLRGQQENRLDELVRLGRGTATQQRIIREQDVEIASLQKQINELSSRRDSLQLQSTNTEAEIGTSGKLGTFYYIANTLGVSLDTVVKWFTLVIVFVFDPMSISLFLAYNLIVKKNSSVNNTQSRQFSYQTATLVSNNTESSENAQITKPLEPPINPNTISPESEPEETPNDIPYYRRPGFDWVSGAAWEHDPEALAWRKQVG